MISKIINFSLIFLSLGVFARPQNPKEFIQGYNSAESGLEESLIPLTHKKVYGMPQIQELRRAVKPRYIRVLSFHDSSSKGKILKKGILFTYAAFKAKNVTLSGNFNNWSKLALKRGKYGVYYYILPVREMEYGKTSMDYEYKFLVDGIWVHDPQNKNKIDDGLGSYTSVFHLSDYDANRRVSARVLDTTYKSREKLIEFAIYLPRGQNLSLVGDFNNWNPEMDPLNKGKDGVFRLRKRLSKGTYYYKYVIDGKWILDTYNSQTRYHKGLEELTSVIQIE